jgi:hypothetical protein
MSWPSDPYAARADADFVTGTDFTSKGLPNSIPMSAMTVGPHYQDNVKVYFGASDHAYLYSDGTDFHLGMDSGDFLVGTQVYASTHVHWGDGDIIYKGDLDDSLEQFDGTDHVWTFASLSTADADGGDWRVTAQAAGSGGTGNHNGGDVDLIGGVKQGTGTDGNVNLQGNLVRIHPRAASGTAYGTLDAGQTTANVLTLSTGADLSSGFELATGAGDIVLDSTGWINLESTSGILATGTVTASDAAGPAFADEPATSTNPTLIPDKAEMDTGIGWASDTLHFVLGGASYGNISKTVLTLGVSTFMGDDLPLQLGNAAGSPDAALFSDGVALVFGFDSSTASALKLNNATIADFKVGTGLDATDVYFRTGSALDSDKDGGSIFFEMGREHGTGNQGIISVNGPVEVTPATAIAGLTTRRNGITTTSSDGLLLENSTAATVGMPRIRMGYRARVTIGSSKICHAMGQRLVVTFRLVPASAVGLIHIR